MIDSGEITHAETRGELLAAITSILDAGRLRATCVPMSPSTTSRRA
jgi:hypothetical protein